MTREIDLHGTASSVGNREARGLVALVKQYPALRKTLAEDLYDRGVDGYEMQG